MCLNIFSLQLVSINLLERPQGTKVVWTDVGSLNISEGNGVEFAVTNVPFTGNYKILLRLYPKVRFRLALSLIRNNNEHNHEFENHLHYYHHHLAY